MGLGGSLIRRRGAPQIGRVLVQKTKNPGLLETREFWLTIAATRCALRFAIPGSTGLQPRWPWVPTDQPIIARPSSLYIVRSTYFS